MACVYMSATPRECSLLLRVVYYTYIIHLLHTTILSHMLLGQYTYTHTWYQ